MTTNIIYYKDEMELKSKLRLLKLSSKKNTSY